MTRRRTLASVLGAIACCGAALVFANGATTTTSSGGADPSGENPPITSGQYVTQYSDEFTSSPVGSKDWAVYNNTATTQPQGPKCSCNVFASGGVLHIRATKVNGVWMGGGMSSRVVHTTYGQVLVRAKYDHGFGVKAVALMWPEVGWPPEIDFFETGTDANHAKVGLTNHYSSSNLMQHNYIAAASGWHTYVVPNFQTTDWHTYGVTWTPDSVTYTIDGNTAAVQSGHAPQQRMWLGLQNSLGRTASTKPNSTTPANVDLYVDWVAFMKISSVTSPTATITPVSSSPTAPPISSSAAGSSSATPTPSATDTAQPSATDSSATGTVSPSTTGP